MRLLHPHPAHPAALWQLCGYQTGLLGRTLDSACRAFSDDEINTLEWMEDVQLYERQGPGAEINYK